jgi:predicted dehydrogenase
MNLTPEQRTIGKQNFYESVGTTRREFLAGTVAAAAAGGAGLGAMYFGYGATVETPLRVGIIGTGDEGGVLIGSLNPDYVDVVAIADIRPYNQHRAFHGDINNPAARPGLNKVYKWTDQQAKDHVKVYADKYEDLINDDNVEAVIIALPLWLHDVAAFKAMRAGKHVLCEKLMAQTVGRCKEMGRLAAELKDKNGDPIVLAVGHQRHYSILYANAVDQIKRGLLGELHHIRAQWHRGNLPGSDSWSPPLPCANVTEAEWGNLVRTARKAGPEAEAAVRDQYKMAEQLNALKKKLTATAATDVKAIETLKAQISDKEIQLTDSTVVAEKYGYESKTLPGGRERTPLDELIRWRLWDRTAAGLMAELGSHQLDASSIFISGSLRDDGGKVYPLSVQGIGFRSLFPEDRDVDDHVHCNYEFPGPGYYEDIVKQDKVADPRKRIVVTYSSINGNGFGGYGEVVMGTGGTLVLEREQEVLLFAGDASTKIEVGKDKAGGPTLTTYETGGGAAVAQAATPQNVSRGYREEIEHWAWCIRNPDPDHQPRCTPKVAMADAIIALTSNIAMKTRQRVEFDHRWFDMDDDATPEVDLKVEGAAGPRKTSELA